MNYQSESDFEKNLLGFGRIDICLDRISQDWVELRDAVVVHEDDAVQVHGDDEVRLHVFQFAAASSLNYLKLTFYEQFVFTIGKVK